LRIYFTAGELASLQVLSAVPETFTTVLALLHGGTAFVAFVMNISAIFLTIFWFKKMKTSAHLWKYLKYIEEVSN
jgi:hypothetical protein